MNKNISIYLLGSGGHAKVVYDALLLSGNKVIAVIDPIKELKNEFSILEHIKSDDVFQDSKSMEDSIIVNGIGIVLGKNRFVRRNIYNNYYNKGYKFMNSIHPTSIIASNTKLFSGLNIMAGSIIQTGTVIKSNTIINTGVIIEHDCLIGENVHVAPGVVICGNVKVGDDCFIGAGAKILPESILEDGTIVKSGAIINNKKEYNRKKNDD